MTPFEGESPGGERIGGSPGPGSSSSGSSLPAACLIVLAGVLAYLGSFGGAFVYDDLHNLVENRFLEPLFPPGGWLWADPRFGLVGRPVASFSFALNRALGGLDPWGYHAVNLVIHLATALFLSGLVRRGLECLGSAEGFGGQRARRIGLAVGLLFAVHPVTTGAVTYLYQRCESLMGAALAATVYFALRARTEGSRPAAVAAVCACLLGTGCKETMVVAPLLVLLVDRTLVAGTFKRALAAAPGMYAGLFSSWLAIAVLVATSGARADSVGFDFAIGPWDYLRAQAAGLVLYLRLCLWPAELVFDYGHPIPTRVAQWLPHGLAVLAALALVVRGLARNRPWALLGAWFFLILGPSSSVLPIVTEIWVEHRIYLPLAAVVTAVVLLATRVLGTGRAAAVVLALATVALGYRTHLRQADYRSEVELWRVTLEQRPDNARAHYALGDALRRDGEPEAALEHYLEACRLDPLDAFYRVNPGVLALELGRPELARTHLLEATRLMPEWSLAHQNLGLAQLALNQLDAARASFERALELAGDNWEAARGLGMTHARAGRAREAMRVLEVVVTQRPQDVEALVELGELLLDGPAALRDRARALELARRAAQLSDAERVRALLERARESL